MSKIAEKLSACLTATSIPVKKFNLTVPALEPVNGSTNTSNPEY